MSKNIKRLTKQRLNSLILEKKYLENEINYSSDGQKIDRNKILDEYFKNKVCNESSFITQNNETLYLKSKFYFYKNKKLSEQNDAIKMEKYALNGTFIKVKNITQSSDNDKNKLLEEYKEKYQNLNIRTENVKKEDYIVRDYFENEKLLIKDRIEFLQEFEELVKSCFENCNINYNNITLEYIDNSKDIRLLKEVIIKEENIKKIKAYNINRLFPEYSNNKGDIVESTPENTYKVLLTNTKREKRIFNFILKEILNILDGITKEKIEKILTSKEVNDLIFEYVTTYKVDDIKRFLNATVERNEKSNNSVRKKRIEEQMVIKEELSKLENGELVKKIQELLKKDYDIDKLIEIINTKKPNDFIAVKRIINQHFINQFLKEDQDEFLDYKKNYLPEEKLIIKEINEFMKGRYRKVKKEKRERYKSVKSIFENKNNELTDKIVQRVSSRIYMSYINYNKYKVFLPKNIQDTYKDSSVFKEIVKCEDTFRKKLSTYISELNFMYFSKLNDSNDILGTKNYGSMKLRFKDTNKEFSTFSQISGVKVSKEEFLDKMYSAFELRNHIYHYQKLLKSEIEENKIGYSNFVKMYNNDSISNYVEIFNANLKEDFIHILTSNNIYLLEDEYQDKIINIISSRYENKPTYLVRFDKIFSKKVKYITNELQETISMKEILFNKLELENKEDVSDKFKAIINGSLRYYYQTHYDYLFFEYIEGKNYSKVRNKMEDIFNNNKKKDGGKHPLLEKVNEIVKKSSSLEELMYNLQSDAGDSKKQIKNYNNVYNQLLMHLFYDFVNSDMVLNSDRIIEFVNVDENRNKRTEELTEDLNKKFGDEKFNLVTPKKIKAVFNNDLTLRLFSISEFLKKRSIASMKNDLKKYVQFLSKLEERYPEDFNIVWENVYNKIIGTNGVDFNNYIISINQLIDILELIVLNIDKDKALRYEKDFCKTNELVLDFYGVDGIKLKKEDLKYKFFDTNENKIKDQSIIDNIKKYDDGAFEIRTIPHDFFIEVENQGKVQFLMNKHLEYVNETFSNGYKDILVMYSDLRTQISNVRNMKLIKSKDCNSELEEIKSVRNIIEELVEDNNIIQENENKEFIVYIQEQYKKKYKEFIDIKSKNLKVPKEGEKLLTYIKELKQIINLFDFLSNLINLKSVNKAEQLIHDIHSRYVSGYRDIERNYVYMNENHMEDTSVFKNDKAVEMINKISDVNKDFIFNKKNKSCKKDIISSRNFTIHKKVFQEKENEKRLNGSVNNEGYRLKQIYKYDTKSMKALTDIYVSVFDKKNVCANVKNYEFYDFTYETKLFMEDIEFDGKTSYKGIPLISNLEVLYLSSFIDDNIKKIKVVNRYNNGLFS